MIGTAVGIVLNISSVFFIDGISTVLPSEIAIYTRYFGYAFGGVFFCFALLRQIRKWEVMITEYEEQEYQPREQPSAAVVRPMPKAQSQEQPSNSFQAMRPGTYPDNQREMSELYKVFMANNWRFVRDVLAEARMPDGTENGRPIFKNLTANWDGIKFDWERAGYAANGAVTDAGQEWVESQCMPGTVER